MGDQLDVLFCIGPVLQFHIKRQGDTVAEVSSQVVADHMMGLFDPLALTLTGQSVGLQLGALAFQQVRHINAQNQHATIEECDAQILCAGFAEAVLLYADAGAACHLLLRNAGNLPQFPDTGSDLFIFHIRAGDRLFHSLPLKKAVVSGNS